MDEKKISNAVDALMKDAHWKAEAAAAPSQASLRHMHLEMYYACHNGFSAPRLPVREIKELHAAMYALEDVFTPEDWDSLQKRSKGTFARICLYRREYAMRDALSYPKWRCIYTYISKNNPFRAVAKEHMDSFLQPASDLDAEAEERRMKTAIMRASWNTRWRKA
ncbi:MAG: hypothetical protein LUD50_01695, partial [Clostridia bacterium]|nr:hypothetical protein [Clostridia bacterium]